MSTINLWTKNSKKNFDMIQILSVPTGKKKQKQKATIQSTKLANQSLHAWSIDLRPDLPWFTLPFLS